jgi:hypothetical protein
LIKWFELMKNEQNRLLTFVNEWDSSIITADKMAKAGFFFLHSDHVVCAYCRGEIYNWSKKDDPEIEHFYHFPRCPFVMEEDVGNIPL